MGLDRLPQVGVPWVNPKGVAVGRVVAECVKVSMKRKRRNIRKRLNVTPSDLTVNTPRNPDNEPPMVDHVPTTRIRVVDLDSDRIKDDDPTNVNRSDRRSTSHKFHN
jgi:hypothetical protein